MTILDAIKIVREHGKIELSEGKVRYSLDARADPTTTSAALDILRSNKPAVVELLRDNQEPLAVALKGKAIELWWDSERQSVWLVGSEEDVQLLAERRGAVYTADELSQIIRIQDPEVVRAVHAWKRETDSVVRSFIPSRLRN